MKREEVLQKLEEIFRDVFDDETLEIKEKTNATDIEGWDSLKNISILAAVSDEFSVTFGMDEIISMKNVGDMVNAVLRKI